MEMAEAFRTRKQTVAQNILLVCDFDGRILYVLAGWEGSAHDSTTIGGQ